MEKELDERTKDTYQGKGILKISDCPDKDKLFRSDEPPIGVGGASFFFDMCKTVRNPDPPASGGKYKYKLDKIYTGVKTVQVLTEESDGYITFMGYYIPEALEDKAKLILTVQTKQGGTHKTHEVSIPGDNAGSIITGEKLKSTYDPDNEKKVRQYRLKHPKPEAHVIAWKIVDSRGNVLHSESGADLYYFYISMYHTP